MEVVLDQQQKPQGVFLPLAEWEQLRHGVSTSSELYKLMDKLTEKIYLPWMIISLKLT
jgi:hypothetical protein